MTAFHTAPPLKKTPTALSFEQNKHKFSNFEESTNIYEPTKHKVDDVGKNVN